MYLINSLSLTTGYGE